ncbi:MAG: flavodoxin-dependent (E)-4-hydroxy-3-methylbut-2-enyl-diphosphate synthase [Candidatus Omnitrophica bacterium]|nr:flavodoxin-dependent (E)-4-hydroxy-3-methylbut-2-enyl-diphosphate synthase [Candidatus Omnitrophota bacterium]
MIKRRKTRTVLIGNVRIGAGHPVAIQSMTNTDTRDVKATVAQIKKLEKAGCDIVRVAVRDMGSALAIKKIKERIRIPLVADIHFSPSLALAAIENRADKIRINPGNIQDKARLAEVIARAKTRGTPIRIGINSGSLPKEVTSHKKAAGGMCRAALKYIDFFEKCKFSNIVVSLKSSDVPSMIAAYRELSTKTDVPLHLGVTSAGLPMDGIVKSSVGIGSLLCDGIGDTVRVSITGDPLIEIDAAKRILLASGRRSFGPELIACPSCGRCQVDIVRITEEVDRELQKFVNRHPKLKEKHQIIAVMGCEVNGPGEAKQADIGIAFGKNRGAIFEGGKIVKVVEVKNAVKELLSRIMKGVHE